MPGYSSSKDDVQLRLRRVEGQVRGLQRMVDEDAYCIDVLTQVAAVTKALQAVALELLDGHLNTCVADAIGEGRPGRAGQDRRGFGGRGATRAIVTRRARDDPRDRVRVARATSARACARRSSCSGRRCGR